MYFLAIVQKSCWAPLSSAVGLACLMVETRPTLLEDHPCALRLVQEDPGLRWIFGKPDHLTVSIAQENDVVFPPTHDVDHDPLHETSCERQTHTVLRCPNAVPSSPPTSIILLSSRGGERALNEPRRGCLHLLISQMFWLWQELLFLGHAHRLTMTTHEAIECELFSLSQTPRSKIQRNTHSERSCEKAGVWSNLSIPLFGMQTPHGTKNPMCVTIYSPHVLPHTAQFKSFRVMSTSPSRQQPSIAPSQCCQQSDSTQDLRPRLLCP